MSQTSVFFAGDFCTNKPENITIGPKLHKLLKNCSLKCVNFEGSLQKGDKKIANNTFLLQSDKCPQWLIEHDFNIVSLARRKIFERS